MKIVCLIFAVLIITVSCSDSEDMTLGENITASTKNFKWTIPSALINGSGNPFPLAKDPKLFKASEVEFLADESLAAAVYMNGEIRIYPYVYLNSFESVNDQIDDNSYALTYCPQTQSALLIDRNFRQNDFVLRASGYLLHDNVILRDENTDTYWSQILGHCIKGQFAGELSPTLNFVEMTWKTLKENFPDAKVFTNSSVVQSNSNVEANKSDVKTGDLVYGIIARNPGQTFVSSEEAKDTKIYIYHFDDFSDETKIYFDQIGSRETLIIGNQNDHYITSYINDSNVDFEAIQNEFPIVMKDSNNNYWNVFGVAVSGPREGEQLSSHTGFFALFWAWDKFYDDFIFVD